MSGPDQPDWESDTVPTPRVRLDQPPPPPTRSPSDTLEMPVVRAPAPAAAPPRGRPAGSRPARPAPPVRGAVAPRRRSRPARLAALLAALVVAAGVGVLAGRLVPTATDAPAAVTEAAGAAVTDVRWSSVDPVGGSGFRQVDARTWRTQSYRSPQFGNLKPGVGLLADLGAPREVAEVAVDVAPVGVVVELRAGDRASQDPSDYTVVSRAGEAAGPTTLDGADGGAHRYWLLWVTQLGPREGGYVAELSGPTVAS